MNENSIKIDSLKKDVNDEVKFSCHEMQIIKLSILLAEKDNSLLSLLNYMNSNRKNLGVEEKDGKELLEDYNFLKNKNSDLLKRIETLRDKLYAHFDNDMHSAKISFNIVCNSEIKILLEEIKGILKKPKEVIGF